MGEYGESERVGVTSEFLGPRLCLISSKSLVGAKRPVGVKVAYKSSVPMAITSPPWAVSAQLRSNAGSDPV